MQYLKLFMVFSFITVIGCSPGKKLAKNPELGLKTQIQEMIEMLEKKDFGSFIKTYAHPDDLEKILQDESLEQMVLWFKGKKAQLLLDTLHAALEEDPEFNEDKTKAVFNPSGMDRSLILEKVEERWYIRN